MSYPSLEDTTKVAQKLQSLGEFRHIFTREDFEWCKEVRDYFSQDWNKRIESERWCARESSLLIGAFYQSPTARYLFDSGELTL